MKTKILSIIILSLVIFPMLSVKPIFSHDIQENTSYRADLSSAEILVNKTYLMKVGDISEINLTFTNENKTFTLIVEVLNHTGRLWGVFFENATPYYQAKAANSYKNFLKVMDHVTVYQLKYFSVAPGDYVIALHDSHAHEEPDTHFNLLVVKDQVGVETNISLSGETANDPASPGFEAFLSILALISLLFINHRRKGKIRFH